LLESERDRDAARAALHELQLASRPSAGEFSNSGVKPYSGPRLTEEGEVQQVVEMIESSGGTPRQHTGERSVQSKGEVMGHMATLQRENTRLRVQLEKVNGGPSALETPQAVREALSSSAMKRSAVSLLLLFICVCICPLQTCT